MEPPRSTSPEEYAQIRQKHIVEALYGGNDQLAIEEKERLLLEQYPGSTFNFHATTLDADGKNIGDGHVRMFQKVAILELSFLSDQGLVIEELA